MELQCCWLTVYEASTVSPFGEIEPPAVGPQLSAKCLRSSHLLRHCYSRRERPRISLHSLEQPVEHSLHIQYVGHHGVVLLRGDEAEIPRQKKLIFDFTRGSERNLHKPRKLALSTTATLSQICRNRSRS